eukprot:TRINITY_DN25153_c0_g1_i2.p2 TRINITY_DN25153_c0_g1~~TRINITY_DN25153_c0_g1_i2.p2  ORF type:complete len:162 (+),score=46.72 TRINITY_DN25153_c0_g1_i2:935-1420(+)
MQRMQVLIAAAGARFEKQLRELRKDMKEIQERTQQPGERWPGRVVSDGPPKELLENVAATPSGRDVDDTVSDNADGYSEAGSARGSLAGFSTFGSELGAEDRAELKRIQTIVGAAGTAFSKELQDLRRQSKDLRQQMSSLRAMIDGVVVASGHAEPEIEIN